MGGLVRDLGGGIFAVVVDQDYGKFAGVILLEEAGYCLRGGGGFVAGWDYGDYLGPFGWCFSVRDVVIEFGQAPEVASGQG
jgi:hypothetical protein